MSQFPGPGGQRRLAGASVVLGLAALAYKIHPVLFWALLALVVFGLFFTGKK
jgi:hypothetical protein